MSDTQTTTSKYNNYKFDILNKYFDIYKYKKPEDATFIVKTVYFVGDSKDNSNEEIIYEIEYVDDRASIQTTEDNPLDESPLTSTEWDGLTNKSDTIFVKKNVSIDLKSLSLCLLPVQDSVLNIYSNLKELIRFNEGQTEIPFFELTKPYSGAVYNSCNYGFRNFRMEGFTYNKGVEFEVWCSVNTSTNKLDYIYRTKDGKNFVFVDNENKVVEPFTEGSRLQLSSNTLDNYSRVYGYFVNEYSFKRVYKVNDNYYDLDKKVLEDISESSASLLVEQSIWITGLDTYKPSIDYTTSHIEKFEVFKSFYPNRTFEETYGGAVSIPNSGIALNSLENKYYIKFTSKLYDLNYSFAEEDYENTFYEPWNEKTDSPFIKGGGYFKDADYPLKYRYGETLRIPFPTRNISVRRYANDISNTFNWAFIKYNVYAFLGWKITIEGLGSGGVTPDSVNKLKRDNKVIDIVDIPNSDFTGIKLTPYWYLLSDNDIKSFKVSQKPNRNVFAYAERISSKYTYDSSNGSDKFVPFLITDTSDWNSNVYFLSGLQVKTIVLKNASYEFDENGKFEAQVEPESGNSYSNKFGEISVTVKFDDISNKDINTNTLQNDLFQRLGILIEPTSDFYTTQDFGIFANLLRIDINELSDIPKASPEGHNFINKVSEGGNTTVSYNFFTNFDEDETNWYFYYPIRIFNHSESGSKDYRITVRVQTSDGSGDVNTNLNIDKYPVNSLSDNWKVLLDTNKQITDISLVSLFDLLAYEANTEGGGKSYTTYLKKGSGSAINDISFQSEKNTQMGTKLSHDIILNNSSIYNESHGVYNSDVNSIAWKQNGIDIGLATPDKRNRPYTKKFTGEDEDIITIGPEGNEGYFKFYKKDAYRKPDKVKDIYFPNITTYGTFFLFEKRTCSATKLFLPADSNGQSVSSGWFSPYVEEMFSVQEYETDTQGSPSTNIDDTASVILSCQDTVLQNSLSFGGNLKCWTRLCLNPYNPLVIRFVLAALLNIGENLQVRDSGSLLPSLNSLNAPTNELSPCISSKQIIVDDAVIAKRNYLSSGSYNTTNFSEKLIKRIESAKSDDDPFIYALKHCFVWVRASFAADYVDPTDFDQKLNKDSSVTHKNLLIRNDISNADFNRYHESLYSRTNKTTDESDKSESIDDLKFSGFTFPYIPRNAPLKDYISDEFYKKVSGETNTEILQKIYADSAEEDSEIGSVLSESKGQRHTVTSQVSGSASENAIETTETIVSPIQFLDPDIDYTEISTSNSGTAGSLVYPYEERKPTIIPKSGNLWTDSRILSPTIDEIWYIIKKVISGRDKDIKYRNFEDSTKKYLSQIYAKEGSEYYNDEDHRLSEVNKSFKFKYGERTIEGDPVDYDFQEALSNETETIYNFVVSEYFTQPDSVNYVVYNDISKISETIQKNHTLGSDEKVGIQNIRLANDNDEIVDIDNVSSIKPYNITLSLPEWRPRPTPMSLRELEGAILGNKFNIINNFRFVKENFAVTGKLGYSTSENAGSIYQFHKEYNFSIDNPNTVFHKNGEGLAVEDDENNFGKDIQTGVSVSAGSTETTIEVDEVNLQYYNSEYDPNSSATGNTAFKDEKGRNKLPLLVENYGISDLIPENKNDYSGHDVYLNAMGEWKLENEITRFPILRSKY